ncbi:MAG: hypothetical protein E7456_06870 [Ruminococcaceae bacterium]|nr:hypothetical protein [Oscillospiraceae bacterium]
MKKIISLLLAIVMMFTLVACANDSEETVNPPENTTTEDNSEENTEETVEGTTEETPENEGTTDAEATDSTLGQTLLADFTETLTANPGMTAQEAADHLITNPAILFAPATMPVEEGYLSGFTTEITGFEEGVMFAPMIGSIAFVGYVFTLEDGADVDSFMNNLVSTADMRWNICVEAEEMIVDHVDNTVFFVMCPEALEA